MTNKYKSVIYNKILLLSMDIESALGDDYVIEKMYVYFNKNFVEGKYIKPYAIKFILNQLDPDDSNRKILQSEEYKYSLEDIYDALGIIPLYLIKSYPKTNYGFVDINVKAELNVVLNFSTPFTLIPFRKIFFPFISSLANCSLTYTTSSFLSASRSRSISARAFRISMLLFAIRNPCGSFFASSLAVFTISAMPSFSFLLISVITFL